MNVRHFVRLAVVFTVLAATAPLAAQMQTRSDSIAHDYFAPRFVLANAEEIGLTRPQRTAIEVEATGAAEAFTGLRFDLDTALRRLIGLSNQVPVDEDTAVSQLQRVLDLEGQIKFLQLRMVVRIKNVLTPEQHDQLLQIRRRSRVRAPR